MRQPGQPQQPRIATGTAPLPAALVLPPPAAAANPGNISLTREPARDTLAPSSFGTIGAAKPAAAAPYPVRAGRAPLPTLGELEGATATATLRPPGAVPPPPRALPMATPALDAGGVEPAAPAPPGPTENATLLSGSAAASAAGKPESAAALEATLDMSGSVSRKVTQAALVEQTRISEAGVAKAGPHPTPNSGVPAPGLFIADEPLGPRPKLSSVVSAQRELLSRMRVVVLVLGALLLMAAGALVVMFMRRVDVNAAHGGAPPASAAPPPPACALSAPPSRISIIERTVPISAVAQADGLIALGIADTKSSAAGWLYDPLVGEPKRKLEAPEGNGDVSHVSPTDPLLVDHANPDFAFAQTLAPGLALGVGPAGLLRRGDDGATGVVWPLGAGSKVTPPRAVSTSTGHFVAFRQGGTEGQIVTLWLGSDGVAAGPAASVEGAPRSLGTPNVALLGERAVVLFSARADKAEPYRVYAALAAPSQGPSAARALELPAEGGGAIAPSLAALPGSRYLAQWTDGNVGQYQVHVRMLDNMLRPMGEPLLVSGKGANAGQGTIVTSARATVSFFIQTTAGHDELWGATVSCH